MARPTTLKGSKLLIQLGNGATPTEVFTAPCALASRGINFSADVNEFRVPDCTDPDVATWTERVVSANSATVSGSGTLAMESLTTYWTWYNSGLAKNIRVKVDATALQGGGYWAMSAVLTTFNVGGNDGELASAEIEIQSHGVVTWVPAV